LFSGRSFECISKGQVFLLFFFEELFRNVLVYVETRIGGCLEGSQIGLYSFMEFFGELPDRLVGFSVEVVILFEIVVIEDLEGLNQLIYFLGIHLF